MAKYYNDDEFYVPPEGYYGSDKEREDRAYSKDNFERMVKQNELYQKWRKRAIRFLLTNIGPRIFALDNHVEHRYLESYANVLHHLNLIFQFGGNNVWQHQRMLTLMHGIPRMVRFLEMDIRNQEEVVRWRKANPNYTWEEFDAWDKHRVEKIKRKTFLRCKRINRAYLKAKRLRENGGI